MGRLTLDLLPVVVIMGGMGTMFWLHLDRWGYRKALRRRLTYYVKRTILT
jgi:hypothetical protein